MIRIKGNTEHYPSGLPKVNYHLEDVSGEFWHPAIVELIELIKRDSSMGWAQILQNFVSSLISSTFFPVLNTFSEWDSHRGSSFAPQVEAILEGYAVWKDGRLICQSGYDHNNPTALVESLGTLNLGVYGQADLVLEDYVNQCPVCWPGYEGIQDTRPTRRGAGSRWMYASQKDRISSYSCEDLYEMLTRFSALGGAIPTTGWETNLSYGRKVKLFCSNYADYLKTAYLLPPSWYLLDVTFSKSWLELLIDAGVLADGKLPTGRGYRCIARDGHECFSLAELEIDNWLTAKNISHTREVPYPYHAVLNSNQRLRADFEVKGVLIEYAGLLDDSSYRQKIEVKKQLASAFGMKLIVLTPQEIGILDDVFGVL